MTKAKYIKDSDEFPSVMAYSQPENPGYWYVVFNGVVLDVRATTTGFSTSDVDLLLDVLNKIKKEESKA